MSFRYAGPTFHAPPRPYYVDRHVRGRDGRIHTVRARVSPPRPRGQLERPPVKTPRPTPRSLAAGLPLFAAPLAAPIDAATAPLRIATDAIVQTIFDLGPSMTNTVCAPGKAAWPACACPGGRVDPDGLCSATRAPPGTVGGGGQVSADASGIKFLMER